MDKITSPFLFLSLKADCRRPDRDALSAPGMQIGRLAGSDGVNVFEPIEVHGVVPNRQLTAVDLHESIEHYLPVPFIDLCQ